MSRGISRVCVLHAPASLIYRGQPQANDLPDLCEFFVNTVLIFEG